MSCCTSSAFPSPPSYQSPLSSVKVVKPEEPEVPATPLTLVDFTTLVSAALSFNTPIFEPLALPCRPNSSCFSSSFQNNLRSLKTEEKLTMLKKIKSVLLREPQSSVVPTKRSPRQVPELPNLPLPPPTDPIFTPHMPLPIALERGLVSCSTELISPTASEDCESCQLSSSCSQLFSPCADAQSSSSSMSSEGYSTSGSESLSHASSSVYFTSDPADPFAKGHVQVVRRSTGSSSSSSSYGSVCMGAYTLGNHPYATSQRDHSPPKKSKKKFITATPPPCPLILPPRLPMPTRPLPPTPDTASRNQLTPRSPTRDWTLDLPIEGTAFDSFRVAPGGASRRKVGAKTRRARRASLKLAVLANLGQFPVKKDDPLGGDLRPGHRRKGSPFPLLFELPPNSIASPSSTPTSLRTPESPQQPRKSRPPMLVLSPAGLPVPPPSSGSDVTIPPISPISMCSSTESAVNEPLGGRANVPGWFSDDCAVSEQGHRKPHEEEGKIDGEERYWTAPESTSTHAH
ncbi:hypothetical protein E1B28_000661 [Marasmius oreades]|uniref:Uncharacterized protein n=1 Tax=Marasmius oreades TaxID=181124 RepID=A0A9P7V1R6_9AGAR|nr:uncharacterized protein E1B28_000661 [Marasmius oreades]KAG7098751.1 hypothetical protein E1B28_000661 [Marasmius oreades]